jgi:hypothetical protein
MIRVRWLIAAVAVLGAWLSASAQAAQRLPVHRLVFPPGLSFASGGPEDPRYVPFAGANGIASLRDTKTTKLRALPTLPTCSLRTFGSGRTAFFCPDPAHQAINYVTTTLDGRDPHTVTVPQPVLGGPPLAVGTQWITASVTNSRDNRLLYLNWHTGEQRLTSHSGDLNTPNLAKPPLANPRTLPRARKTSPMRLLIGKRRVQISACASGCSDGSVTNGNAYWIEHGRYHVYSLASKHTGTFATIDPKTTFIYYRTHYEVGFKKTTIGASILYARLTF